MTVFRPRGWLDRAFAVGIVAKGLNGVVEVVGGVLLLLVTPATLLDRLWAYPWLIVVLLLFIAYQLYRIVLDPTAGLVGLTLFDAAIVVLTWREYGEQRRRRHERAPVPAA